MKKRLLCLSAYDATSHAMWRTGLQREIDADWVNLILPPRHFAWRKRSNPLSWYLEQHDVLSQRYDGVIATNTVDGATLRGLVPSLAQTPWITYFHDNQFSYPSRDPSQPESLEPKFAIYDVFNLLASDAVVFNSEWNRQSMRDGLEQLRGMMPDHFPKGLPAILDQKSSVIPVGIDDLWFEPHDVARIPNTILWNHRWEWDKAPERFAAIVDRLAEAGVDFQLAIAGPRFRETPPAFDHIQQTYPDRVIHFGTVDSVDAYRTLVRSCHVVISTARHEFQGLAVQESAAAGVIPIVPDRLAYRDYVPPTHRYLSSDALEDEIEDAADMITRAFDGSIPHISVESFRWSEVRVLYDDLISSYF